MNNAITIKYAIVSTTLSAAVLILLLAQTAVPSLSVGNTNATTLNLTNTTMATQMSQTGTTTNFTNPQLADPEHVNLANTTSATPPPHDMSMSTDMSSSSPMASLTPSTEEGLPIPEGKRMFTEEKSNIMRVTNDPLVVEIVQTPKSVAAEEPITYVMNLFSTNGTWLWHSDFDISVVNARTGEKALVMPNIHGHGGMAQFTYTFPSPGTYNVDVTFGQQVNSPNYITPHGVKKAVFTVNVGEKQTTTNTTTADAVKQAPIKEIPINVFSWGFEPNKIAVNKGDLVRLQFTTLNDEVSLYNGHGFGIEGYDVNVFLVKGTDQTVDFIAEKPGTFTFRCTSFCALPDAPASEHFHMAGSLIVNE